MDLFDKPNKKKEFLEDGSVIINLKSNSKYKITVNQNIIKVEQFGALNKINRGLVGEKLYNLDTVTGTQIKEPGLTTGYFVIQTPGTPDIRGGVQKAVKDENSILYTKSESDLIHELKDYIEYYLIHKEPPKRNTQSINTIDEFTFEVPTETVFTSNQPVEKQSVNTQQTSTNQKKEKKKPKGCAIGCLTAIGIFFVLLIIGLAYGCQSNSQEKEWIEQLKQEKTEAEQLYAVDLPAEEKATQAREKMVELEQQFTSIQDETGKNQTDYPLIRAYVDVREMYVAIKHIAENDEAEKFDSEYFQANNEAEQILRDNYE